MTETAVPTADRQHHAEKRYIYAWGGGRAEGDATMRDLLGGKGAGLAEMANLGLPVPPGFTITTAVCTAFYANNKRYPDGLRAQVDAALLGGAKQHRRALTRILAARTAAVVAA